MTLIADSGLVIALLDRRDQFHSWAVDVVNREEPLFLVCEAVCAEVAAVIGTPDPVLVLLQRGDLQIAFALEDEIQAVQKLTRKIPVPADGFGRRLCGSDGGDFPSLSRLYRGLQGLPSLSAMGK